MSKIFLISYLIFLTFISFYSLLFIDVNFKYLDNLYSGVFAKREFVTLLYLTIIGLFYIYYFRFLSYFRNKEDFSKFRKILVLTFIGLFLSYPAALSYDIFNYVLTAKVLFYYHENPYIVMPVEFISDPLLVFTRAANKTALYGPLWIVLSGLPFLLGFGNLLLIILNFKLFVIVSYLLLIFLIYKMTRSLFKTSLFALNPLVIIETFVSGHNDVVMMLLAMFSLYLLVKQKYLYSTLLITLSIFIKYATTFLLPTFTYVLFQKTFKRKINSKSIYLISFLSMFFIFLLSAFREEIYPWYSLWFLCFIPLLSDRKLTVISIAFSIGMLLRYIPFMLTGSYFGITPLAKIILMWIPILVVILGLRFGYFNLKFKED